MENRRVLLGMTVISAAIILSGCNTTSSSGSDAYSRIAGTWKGEWLRGSQPPQSIEIMIQPSGSYTWAVESGFRTNGQLSGSGATLGYANGAGSRGEVAVTANRLVWKNTLTGNNYTVTVSR